MSDDIKSRDLLVLAKTDPTSGEKYDKDGYVLRVVEWSGHTSKGKAWTSIKLERRKLYLDKNSGEIRNGKAEGMTVEDLRTIQEMWDAVMKAMQGAPKTDVQQRAAQKPQDGLEEVPF